MRWRAVITAGVVLMSTLASCGSNPAATKACTGNGHACTTDAQCCTSYCMLTGQAAYCQEKAAQDAQCSQDKEFCTEDRRRNVYGRRGAVRHGRRVLHWALHSDRERRKRLRGGGGGGGSNCGKSGATCTSGSDCCTGDCLAASASKSCR